MRLRKAPKFFIDECGSATVKKVVPKISTVQVERELIPIAYYENDLALSMDGARGYTMFFDIESYINYFLIGFKCWETGKYVIFEDSPDATIDLDKLNWLIWNFRLVGFNSAKYDIIMTMLALRGYKAERLKQCTRAIIPAKDEDRVDIVQLLNNFNLKIPAGIDHIDLINVCPLKGSLKKRAARLHAKRLQELPYHFDKALTKLESEHVRNYCLGSDIVATELIFNELSEQFKLRYDLSKKYGVDVRSKSDAQIAESVIKAEIKRKTGKTVKLAGVQAGAKFQYQPPEFLKFDSVGMNTTFQTIEDMVFEITSEGKLSMPDSLLNLEMQIGDNVYKLGKGGLHSKEKCRSYKAINGMKLYDIDYESFYPKLIINSGLYPKAIGPIFLEIFEEIVNRRLDAKAGAKRIKEQLKEIQDKLNAKYIGLNLELETFSAEADGLKITINGTFGKLGSRWSIMYAPDLLIQVTLTGQLLLLMLIERMEAAGLQVVSANTDGIVLYIHESQHELMTKIRNEVSKEVSIKMEETEYKALYSADVNNYIAVKMDNKCKLKGRFSNPWNDKDMAIFRFHKNPMRTICIEAIEKMLTENIPVEQTIRECTDLTKFICVRDVKGGAHKNGIYLGKTVRWYYSTEETGTINYVLTGNNVPESEGARYAMDLPEFIPDDLDYGAYVEKANNLLEAIGFYERPVTLGLF